MPTVQRVTVRPIRVKLICDCGGEMFTFQSYTATTTQYLNRCGRCSAQVQTDKSYPGIDYVPMDEHVESTPLRKT